VSRRHVATAAGVSALDTIYARYEADPVFEPLRRQASFVPGEGDADAPFLMLVGEAPGKNEDQVRRPFVGEAGDVLNSLFEATGQLRAHCWLTNLVKYRPRYNRFDGMVSPDMFRRATEFLVEEANAVRPTKIALLGNKALQSVFPAKRIGQCHGQQFEKAGFRFYPLYHPAVTLEGRSPHLLPTLVEEFAALFA
jgi:uracil-DNA glycosylase family 4